MEKDKKESLIEKFNNVLVIDDDTFMIDILSRYLTQLGFNVTAVQTGEEAVKTIKKTKIHISIVDLLLFEMDGIELINKFKIIDDEMIIILITGHPSFETAVEALKLGVQDYLVKPFKLEQLDKVLKKSLEEKKMIMENKNLRKELKKIKDKLQYYKELVNQSEDIKQWVTNNLQKLEELKDKGIITEEEYKQRRNNLNANK